MLIRYAYTVQHWKNVFMLFLSTNERGPSLAGLLDSSCRYKRFLFSLDCSSQSSTKYLVHQCTLFQFLFNHCPASWKGSHAGSPVQYISSLKVVDTTASLDSSPVSWRPAGGKSILMNNLKLFCKFGLLIIGFDNQISYLNRWNIYLVRQPESYIKVHPLLRKL